MTPVVAAARDDPRPRGAVRPLPEIWAGIECTMNRVQGTFLDQLEYAGHYTRTSDVDRLADLGVSAVRYPVLWERHEGAGNAAWETTARALGRLRDRGVRAIVGLVHHGSGPRDTSLIDPRFAEGLARFAERVARRFPWVENYTPINEPLTTARFSLLYGLWYPHLQSAEAFETAMLVQTRAAAMAMSTIRQVVPTARFIQTEDVGYTHATPRLRYQADFENERRWLTFDLLAGRVTPGHPLWNTMRRSASRERDLDALAQAPCPPDVLGVNHYLTSERYLDDRIDRYPASTHGGNGRHRYADVEAIRALEEGVKGPRRLLRELWQRYRLPLAVTEVHLGCSREQQLRWLSELVEVGGELVDEGVELQAVTAWSAFGSFDWPSLLTRQDGVYESGLFDIRSPSPRPTALAACVRALARGEAYDHPVLDSRGWWHCDRRLLFGDGPTTASSTPPGLADSRTDVAALRSSSHAGAPGSRRNGQPAANRRLAVLGSGGTLGQAFLRLCTDRQLDYVGVSRASLDITDSRSVAAFLDEIRPWAVVNAAGFVRVDDAEDQRDACRLANTRGPAVLAAQCGMRGTSLVTFSSDLVFGGGRSTPFVESDPVAPLGMYGRSKADAERLVCEIMPAALVVRTSAFFGDWDDHNFLSRTLANLALQRRVRAATDSVVSPTYLPDLVNAALDLLIDGERGIWHLANPGALSWMDLATLAATVARVGAASLEGCAGVQLGLVARRPDYSALGSERGNLLPPLTDAIVRYAMTRPWERLMRRTTRSRDGIQLAAGTIELRTRRQLERMHE